MRRGAARIAGHAADAELANILLTRLSKVERVDFRTQLSVPVPYGVPGRGENNDKSLIKWSG